MKFFPDNITDVKYTEYHGSHSESRQQHLAPLPSEFPAIGHTFIFNEVEFEPVAQHIVRLSNVVMGLDINFQHLVSNDYECYQKDDFYPFHLL